ILDEDERARTARAKALEAWPKNPVVDFLIGEKLSQHRRFTEGSEFLRRAIEADPDHLGARKALGQNLLRLGHDEEGWKLIGAVQAADKYDVETYNLMLLHDHLESFETIESGRFVVRMTPGEAAVYGPRVIELLEEAGATLERKYGFQPEGRVVVDFFPDQQDFAIRTLGFPGGIGLLGACFGNVIAMNSPGSAGAMGSNWESTLWHEFCHTVTLGATRSRIPRWLTEGISVHEERQRDPSCGHKMTPDFRRRILEDEGLIPIAKLSAALTAFNDPKTIDFAYFQASILVEYMLEEFGETSLRPVLDDLRTNADVEAVLARRMATVEELDEGFAGYAVVLAEKIAPDADWEVPEPGSSLRNDPGALEDYLEEHPDSIWALWAYSWFLIGEREWEDARETATKLVRLFPEFIDDHNGYEALARACRNLGDVEAERDALREWAKRDGEAAEALERLIEIDLEDENWPAIEDDARRLLAINPLLRSPHRALGLAAQQQDKGPEAIRAYETLLHLDPVNPADAHYRLGQLYAGDDDARAKRHLLEALEEAPRFRAAHRLLLDLPPDEDPPRDIPVPDDPEPAAP
ncbi:MAG: tetratricopeptide repeat protein, partial [Akkermansiaceae bacterium]|nr:tetratricopeptide repeat protein [Akkermansiaceae bacterium]